MTKHSDALRAAQTAWVETAHLTPSERIRYAEELDRRGIFGVAQLSKICRLSRSTTLKRGLGVGVTGGRFEPSACSTLALLSEKYAAFREVSESLVRVALEAGCSPWTIARLANIPPHRVYQVIEGSNDARSAAQ